ncbi:MULTISPECIES: PPE domain-containing protein [Mycolicibacter]|uniref:PPE domain-containing protein n=2 Tax=Mycolicibacter TaxID=1073531 RepID=A0ABU5XKZ5_9MYCO|nr:MULTISPECIES: PPE domain-containing protein [unclassified Mycolicibacter]MEB3022958.1 PPE domain-containing protein [Mycolicibacter sp. MYC098]MEB3033468.1 PPE domain-containing protein [Mycolicibacter sp. MYC340]
MPTEPWGGYIPEINAGRYEAGTGSATWAASAEMWVAFGTMVGTAMGAFASQVATMGINWLGTAPTAMAASAMAFGEWLVEMEMIAAVNAAACTAVAVAYAAGEAAMIPLPVVNDNRIAEMIAEATNFMGVNSGLIAALNAEYAEFWGQNAATMLTYDTDVTTATLPKPTRPPPPLASLASSAAGLGDAMARAAAKSAIGAASQSSMQGLSAATQAGSAAAEAPASQMSSMMGSAGQFMSMPGQALGQVSSLGGQLGSPLQSLMSPFQSLISNLGGGMNATDASAFGIGGPAASGFDGTLVSSGGAGGFVPGGFGGGLGGSMMGGHSAYMGASGPAVRNQPVFSGVAAKESELAVSPASGNGGGLYGGGGTAPHAAGAQAGGSARRASSEIMAVQPVKATLSAEEREAEELFKDT